jgi:hypothetical protein
MGARGRFRDAGVRETCTISDMGLTRGQGSRNSPPEPLLLAPHAPKRAESNPGTGRSSPSIDAARRFAGCDTGDKRSSISRAPVMPPSQLFFLPADDNKVPRRDFRAPARQREAPLGNAVIRDTWTAGRRAVGPNLHFQATRKVATIHANWLNTKELTSAMNSHCLTSWV